MSLTVLLACVRAAVCRMPVARAGDLFSLLHASENGQLPEAQCRFYCACVGLAIKHIHSKGFLYCDIKLENVLVGADGYVKLCDFGLAKKIIDVPRQQATVASVVASLWGDERHKEARSFSKCGTDQYAPPEVVDGSGRSKAADWWALGVLLHEMLTGHSPFEGKGMNAIFAKVKDYADGGGERACGMTPPLSCPPLPSLDLHTHPRPHAPPKPTHSCPSPMPHLPSFLLTLLRLPFAAPHRSPCPERAQARHPSRGAAAHRHRRHLLHRPPRSE